MSYSSVEHRKRFAAWCASSAARSSPKCRFKVEQGMRLIEASGLNVIAAGWDQLPFPDDFDKWHSSWRKKLIQKAPRYIGTGEGRNFSHGVAAKMINCYLKPLFITGVFEATSSENEDKRNASPIDRVLLDGLAKSDVGERRKFWQRKRDTGWSTFSSGQYESVIDAVREVTGGALWKIEQYWPGHQ